MELDVEVVEYTEKVQKGRSCAANWTLKRRNAQSPKGKKLRGGLDIEAEERRTKVQKKKICTWEQLPGRRLFPQIEVIN